MEFLSYDKAIENLNELGVEPARREGGDDLVCFELKAEGVEEASVGPSPEGGVDRVVKVGADKLPELLDVALHAFHLQDVMVVPSSVWRDVLDLIAFDMASDEAWQDIDAEANLHARSRDPLLMPPDSRETLLSMVRALIANGEDAKAEVTILAVGSPVAIGVRQPAELRLSCPAPVMQNVMGKLEEHAG